MEYFLLHLGAIWTFTDISDKKLLLYDLLLLIWLITYCMTFIVEVSVVFYTDLIINDQICPVWQNCAQLLDW